MPVNAWDLINKKRIAYQETFLVKGYLHPQGKAVMADLRKFCQVDSGGLALNPISRQADPLVTAYRAGMRDVYARIEKYLNLDPISKPLEVDNE